jgi:hypothetical protein
MTSTSVTLIRHTLSSSAAWPKIRSPKRQHPDPIPARRSIANVITWGGIQATIGELSVLLGAAAPISVLLSWWATGAQLTVAVSATIWTSPASIVVVARTLSQADRAQACRAGRGWSAAGPC